MPGRRARRRGGVSVNGRMADLLKGAPQRRDRRRAQVCDGGPLHRGQVARRGEQGVRADGRDDQHCVDAGGGWTAACARRAAAPRPWMRRPRGRRRSSCRCRRRGARSRRHRPELGKPAPPLAGAQAVERVLVHFDLQWSVLAQCAAGPSCVTCPAWFDQSPRARRARRSPPRVDYLHRRPGGTRSTGTPRAPSTCHTGRRGARRPAPWR